MAKQVTVKIDRDVQYLPAIAMRGLVVFPNNIVHFEVGRDKSIAAIEWAMNNNSSIYLVTQKDMLMTIYMGTQMHMLLCSIFPGLRILKMESLLCLEKLYIHLLQCI